MNAINVLGDEAQLAYETGRCAEAIAIYTKVQALSEERYKLDRHEEEYLKQQAHNNHQLSRVLEKTGQWDEAIKKLTIAIEKSNQLIAKHPLSHRYQQNLAVSYGNRGLIYSTINKITEAEADIRHELKLMEELVKANPTFANRRELARSHGHLGHILFNRKQFTEGEQELLESIKQFNQLLQLQPGEIEVRMLTANTHMTLGSIYFNRRVIKKAIQSHTQAYEEFSTLVKLCPQHTLHRILLGGACCNLGLNHMVSNQLDTADTWLKQADGHLRIALKEEPGDSTAQTFSRNTMFARAGVLYLRGNSREAVALVNRVWKMPMHKHEVKELEHISGEIHDQLISQARQSAEKHDWSVVHEIISLLAVSEKLTPARQLELLKFCNQALLENAQPDFATTAMNLVTMLNQQQYFKSPKQLQNFQSEEGLMQVRQLPGVAAILQSNKVAP